MEKEEHWVWRSMRWMRDQFASWFATAWLYVILWAVVGLAFAVLLYIDAVFSRRLAPDSINPLSFQGMGIAYRLFAASFLMAAARCAFKGIPGRWTFRALGVFASIIVCLHAFGFGFEALDSRRDQAMAARAVAEIAETSNADVIAQLTEQKQQVENDTTAAVAVLDTEIRQYITDGRNNDDLADESRARRIQLQDDARAQKQELDAEILRLTLAGSDARSDAVAVVSGAEPWAPLFVGMAQLFSWTKAPSDWTIYLCAIGFIVFWVLLGESIVIFLPERIYLMHLRDAELARRSEAAKKGHETRKANEDATFTTPPQVEDVGYWEERIGKALRTVLKKPTDDGMRNSYFPGVATVPELRAHLNHQLKKGLVLDRKTGRKLTQDDVDFILRQGPYAPVPVTTNSHDKGTDDDRNEDHPGTDLVPHV